MLLAMNPTLANGYSSGSQKARLITEAWGAENLYCPACSAPKLEPSAVNRPVIDYECPTCAASYQLKSSCRWSDRRVPDAGYSTMMAAIRSNCRPNLLVMHYDADWYVQKLLLVPSFFLTQSAIQKRKPLAAGARRAGWVGCNILLDRIAPEGKLWMVSQGKATDPAVVYSLYRRVQPLSRLDVSVRGWTLDVLRGLRNLNRVHFSLKDAYTLEAELALLYPNNRNIRPKIRQQLQVLRDLGLLRFLGGGSYAFTTA